MQPPPYPRDVTDRMVRESLSRPANLGDFVRQALPDLAARLDFAQARPVPREFFTPDWHGREADLPFEVPLLAGEEGASALVFVLVEHQSDTDPLLPLRMLFCTVGFWARQWQQWQASAAPRGPLRLSPVIPLVLYTAALPWGSNTSLAELMAGPEEFHRFVPAWEPLFWNLAQQTPQTLLAGGPWLQFLAVLRTADGAEDLFRTTLEQAGHNLFPLAATETVRWAELLRVLFEYAVWRRSPAERAEILETLRRTNPGRQEVEAMANTIAEEWIRQGEERGDLRTARRFLRDTLEVKFGPLPEPLVQQIEAVTDLERLRQAHGRATLAGKLEDFTL